MKKIREKYVGLAMVLGLVSGTVYAEEHAAHVATAAAEHGTAEAAGPACSGFGPQTPRDIDSKHGENKVVFAMAPDIAKMNLCNIHFHKNAEHKAKDFSIHAEGEHGAEGGFQCNMSKNLSAAELAPVDHPVCKGEHGELKPGDTIEVHWVHTSNPTSKPGPNGLGDCLSENIKNPALRVESQVFVLVNDPKALDFTKLGGVKEVNGYQQASEIPNKTGKPVMFTGSTTGPSWNDQKCSPMQVTWSVRPMCAKLDINSIGKWCDETSMTKDRQAHGVRKLVTEPALLSEIRTSNATHIGMK